MNIGAISNTYYYNNRKLNFKAWNREVYKQAKDDIFSMELAHRNTTYILRNRNFWKPLAMFLASAFKDVPHVNVYDYGCSNGAEAYTFIMSMLSNLKKEIAEKFFPVMAKDYDEYAIKIANEKLIPVSQSEIYNINNGLTKNFKEFFDEAVDDVEVTPETRYRPKPILSENVKFEVADIREDYKNIKPENSIVFARNFWPYLGANQAKKLAKNLAEKLGKTSYLILGKFDLEHSEILKYFDEAGFKCVLPDYVFAKR